MENVYYFLHKLLLQALWPPPPPHPPRGKLGGIRHYGVTLQQRNNTFQLLLNFLFNQPVIRNIQIEDNLDTLMTAAYPQILWSWVDKILREPHGRCSSCDDGLSFPNLLEDKTHKLYEKLYNLLSGPQIDEFSETDWLIQMKNKHSINHCLIMKHWSAEREMRSYVPTVHHYEWEW